MSAGIHSGIAPMANIESIAPNCSLLRRFKTSGSVENTCSILGARGVPRAASTYCIKYANCSAVTFEYGFDSICWKVACSSAGVNWLKDIRARAWLDSSVYASAYFRPATAMKNGFAARRYLRSSGFASLIQKIILTFLSGFLFGIGTFLAATRRQNRCKRNRNTRSDCDCVRLTPAHGPGGR